MRSTFQLIDNNNDILPRTWMSTCSTFWRTYAYVRPSERSQSLFMLAAHTFTAMNGILFFVFVFEFVGVASNIFETTPINQITCLVSRAELSRECCGPKYCLLPIFTNIRFQYSSDWFANSVLAENLSNSAKQSQFHSILAVSHGERFISLIMYNISSRRGEIAWACWRRGNG